MQTQISGSSTPSQASLHFSRSWIERARCDADGRASKGLTRCGEAGIRCRERSRRGVDLRRDRKHGREDAAALRIDSHVRRDYIWSNISPRTLLGPFPSDGVEHESKRASDDSDIGTNLRLPFWNAKASNTPTSRHHVTGTWCGNLVSNGVPNAGAT